MRGTEVERGFTLSREAEISFNDEMTFQAASNTCQRSTGRRARQALQLMKRRRFGRWVTRVVA